MKVEIKAGERASQMILTPENDGDRADLKVLGSSLMMQPATLTCDGFNYMREAVSFTLKFE